MKNLKSLLFIPGLLLLLNASAQGQTNLNLSDEYPSSGEKIHPSYNPSGSAVFGKKNISAAVFFKFP